MYVLLSLSFSQHLYGRKLIRPRTVDPNSDKPISAASFAALADGQKPRFHTLFHIKDAINRIPCPDLYQSLATNIHKIGGDRFFHSHGPIDPLPSIKALGLPETLQQAKTFEECIKPYQDAVGKLQSVDLQKLMSDTATPAQSAIQLMNSKPRSTTKPIPTSTSMKSIQSQHQLITILSPGGVRLRRQGRRNRWRGRRCLV